MTDLCFCQLFKTGDYTQNRVVSVMAIYRQQSKLGLGSGMQIYRSTGISVFLSTNSSESRVLDFSNRQCSVQLPPVESNEIGLSTGGAGVLADMGSGGSPSFPFCLFIFSVQLL